MAYRNSASLQSIDVKDGRFVASIEIDGWNISFDAPINEFDPQPIMDAIADARADELDDSLGNAQRNEHQLERVRDGEIDYDNLHLSVSEIQGGVPQSAWNALKDQLPDWCHETIESGWEESDLLSVLG